MAIDESLLDNLLTPDWLAPSQYADLHSSQQTRFSSEQRLVLALLRDCILEYQTSSRRGKLSALHWLAEHEQPANAAYFSFPYCCEVLGYSAEEVREVMVRACETLILERRYGGRSNRIAARRLRVVA